MLRRTKFAWWLAGLLVVVGAARAAGNGAPASYGFPVISSFSTDEIGVDTETYSVTRAPDGVLYFGGNAILSFDGERWSRTAIPQLSAIYGLDIGADGKLWVGGNGEVGWFERLLDSSLRYHSLDFAFPADAPLTEQIFGTYADGSGAVFVSTRHVYRWTGTRMESWAFHPKRRLFPFRIQGTIYFQDPEQGLFRMTRTGPQLEIPQAAIGPNTVGVVWMDPGVDRTLLVTGAGILAYHNGQAQPFAPEVSALIRNAAVTCGVRLPDGRYAIGTLKEGIIVMRPDGSLDTVLRESSGLQILYVPALLVDGDGSLWAPSPSQILRITLDSDSRLFDTRAGLKPNVIHAITGNGTGISVASRDGIFSLAADHRHFIQVERADAGAHDIVASPDGLIVCGYKGAWLINQSHISSFPINLVPAEGPKDVPNDVQTALVSRVPGETLIATDPDATILARSANGKLTKIVNQLPDAATSLAEDNAGHLWIGTDTKGVFVAPRAPTVPATALPISGRLGLPAPAGIARVRRTATGTILVFGNNGAWVRPSADGPFVPVEDYPTRPLAAVSNFKGNVGWVVHSASAELAACVGEIVVSPTGARWVPHSTIGLDAIGAPRSIFAEQDASGKTVLWIGGTKSVLRHVVEVAAFAPKPRSPLLHALVRLKANSGLQPISGILPYSTRAIVFEFAAPEFLRRPQLRLQTRIDGIDNEWVPAGPDSRRVLTALRDGTYTFRVRTVAETGIASEPTVFTFEVAPPWWRTPWADALGVLVLVGAGLTGYRWRVNRLRRRTVELEEKVRERTEELAEASAAKTLFVANMSHDIRNPLNGIVGLSLALEDTRLDPKQRELIATLRECTTYLSSLVDDVLDFASIEAGKIELRPGPFVPSELLNSVVTTLKADTATRGAFITIETDPEVPPMLRADAGRIQQILVNYVSNALKYAGGHIRLAAGVSASSPGEIEFSVADDGPGISEAEQRTLFTKFSRLAGARRNHIPGTGLGLASCRLMADFMGGSVGVESAEGRGARFYLRLPLVIATEAAPAPDELTLPPTSVLLVEDTDYNAIAAKAVLAKLGLGCERAATGAEALKLFAEKRHNIVLLDRNLPDMDGTEIARRMRDLETDGLHSVLLAVTAYCTEQDRALCLQAGMDAFVGKPLTPEKLRKVLVSAANKMVGTGSVDAAPVPEPAPKLDTSLLEYLADEKSGGLAIQLQRFLAELAEAQHELMATVSRGDNGSIAHAAHRVLGQARMVNATELVEASIALETAARKPDPAAVAAALPRVGREVAALRAALRHRSGVPKA